MKTPDMLATSQTFNPEMVVVADRFDPTNPRLATGVISKVRVIQRNSLRAIANLTGDSRAD